MKSGSTPLRLVIAGLPRCGTTLMATLLNQQRGVRFITDYLHWYSAAMERLRVGWVDGLSHPQKRVCLAMARDELLRRRHVVLVQPDEFETVDELHGLVSLELAAGRAVSGHKAVWPPAQVAAALRATNLHVLVMVRDPRAAVLSYWHRTGGGAGGYLADWRAMVRFGADAGHPRFRLVRYEDLIAHPERTLGEVLRWWNGEPWIPDELSFTASALEPTPWLENSAFQDVGAVLDSSPVGRWEHLKSSPLVRFANATCNPEMRRLGYRSFEQAHLERMRFQMHRAVRGLDRRMHRSYVDARSRLLGALAPALQHNPQAHGGRDSPSAALRSS